MAALSVRLLGATLAARIDGAYAEGAREDSRDSLLTLKMLDATLGLLDTGAGN